MGAFFYESILQKAVDAVPIQLEQFLQVESPRWMTTLAAQAEAWLEGLLLLLALAGPASDLKNPLLRRWLGCYVADSAWHSQKNQAWREVALDSLLSCFPAGQAGAAQEEHLLLPFCPAGVTLEDHIASFAWRAWRPSRCHVDKLPGLLLSAGWMAQQTNLPDLVCSAAPLALSSLKQRHSPTPSFIHRPP